MILSRLKSMPPRLLALREELKDELEIVMRVYFEKPRTTVGWKGLINDPHMDNSFQINDGLRIARKLLLDINDSGLPAAGEFLDMITPQYLADLMELGRNWCTYHRIAGAPRTGVWSFLSGRFQKWH